MTGVLGYLPGIRIESVLRQLACERRLEHHLHRLLLVVLVALAGLAAHALLAVEQVGGAIPHVAQLVDVERQGLFVFLYHQLPAVGSGVAYLGKAHTLALEELHQLVLVLVCHLDNHSGVLGKERFRDVVAHQVVQVDVDAALGIGESHFQQGRYHAACAYVVAGHHPSALH